MPAQPKTATETAPRPPKTPKTPKTPGRKAAVAKRTGSTTGKRRHCRQCGHPRAGHPRKGCPFNILRCSPKSARSPGQVPRSGVMKKKRIFADVHPLRFTSPSPSQSPIPVASRSTRSQEDMAMDDVLPRNSIHSVAPSPRVHQQRASSEQPSLPPIPILTQEEINQIHQQRPERQRQLQVRFALSSPTGGAALSDTAVEIPESHQKSEKQREKELRARIDGWQASLRVPNSLEEARQQLRMPGTFKSPSPEPMITPFTSNMFQSPKLQQSFNLLRNMVSQSSSEDATVIKIGLRDLADMQMSAQMMALHTHAFPTDDPTEWWLVIGKDEASVKLLTQTFQGAITGERRRSVSLSAVASAAIVGAIATWTMVQAQAGAGRR